VDYLYAEVDSKLVQYQVLESLVVLYLCYYSMTADASGHKRSWSATFLKYFAQHMYST